MAVTLFHTGRTPTRQQFGLDQFIEHYKCDAGADAVLTDEDVPQKGDAQIVSQLRQLVDLWR